MSLHGTVKLSFAPPNGAGGVGLSYYKHFTPNGVGQPSLLIQIADLSGCFTEEGIRSWRDGSSHQSIGAR